MAESYGTTSFELLAPAGSLSILKEVIAAGADAVYVGGSRFGARAYAENFTDEELCEAIDYVHLFGRKLYLTVNTLLKNTEISELCEYIRPLYEHGLDAVIVQDFGVIHLLRREFPDLPLHASTQMTITDSDGVRMLGELGISRVVLSRELSIAEMARIHKETGMELEVFVHGALCYSYSGQCLFSSMLGGRSGNRGRCAQPCRLPYQICGQKEKDTYLLSLKDLCGINDLAALRDAGVYSLKIEGRMKQAAYAAGVTACYRRYIDQMESRAAKTPAKTSHDIMGRDVSDQMEGNRTTRIITASDHKDLLALGNRSGFTDGYYHKRNGSDMVTFEKPSYMTQGKSLREEKLKGKAMPSDEVMAPGEAMASGETMIPDEAMAPGENNKIPVHGWAYFHLGEESHLTVIKDVQHRLYHRTESSAVTVTVTGQPTQAASRQPVTEEQIRQRLLKTGDTPFEFEELTIDTDEGIFIPNGELNRMRREALAQLQEELLAPYRRPSNRGMGSANDWVPAHDSFTADSGDENQKNLKQPCIDAERMNREPTDDAGQIRKGHSYDASCRISEYHHAEFMQTKNGIRLIASVSSPQQLDAVLADGRMTDIYLETIAYPREKIIDLLSREVRSMITGLSETIPAETHGTVAAGTSETIATETIKSNAAETTTAMTHPRIYLALPPIFRAHTKEFYSDIADELRKLPINGFLVRNYEEFVWAGRMFPGYRRILDANLYTYNDESADAFCALGADGNTVPPELNRREILKRDNRYSEMVVYGYYPLMVSAQCVHANTATHCDGKPGITRIRDRKGIEFPVCNYCSECVNVVYNSVPTVLFSHMEELKGAGIQGFRLNFTIEDADMVRRVLQILPGRAEGSHWNGRIDFPHTNGHYTRGVE